MTKYIFPLSLFLSSLLCIPAFSKKEKYKADKGFAVVELFTSEGCSSCPPADEAVIDLAKQYKENVFILGFHVDYWDYLGWKDAFSNAAYSERQKQYASAFSLNSIYTPQIVVNGKTELVGSDKSKLKTVIENALSNSAISSIELSARENDDKRVIVNVQSENTANSKINFALVQLQAHTNVARGENQGRLLHHINIVRDFKTMETTGKQVSSLLNIPSGFSKKDFIVIAYVQDKNNMHITRVGSVRIQ